MKKEAAQSAMSEVEAKALETVNVEQNQVEEIEEIEFTVLDTSFTFGEPRVG